MVMSVKKQFGEKERIFLFLLTIKGCVLSINLLEDAMDIEEMRYAFSMEISAYVMRIYALVNQPVCAARPKLVGLYVKGQCNYFSLT